MARQFQVPGAFIVDDENEREFQIPGVYVVQTEPSGGSPPTSTSIPVIMNHLRQQGISG